MDGNWDLPPPWIMVLFTLSMGASIGPLLLTALAALSCFVAGRSRSGARVAGWGFLIVTAVSAVRVFLDWLVISKHRDWKAETLLGFRIWTTLPDLIGYILILVGLRYLLVSAPAQPIAPLSYDDVKPDVDADQTWRSAEGTGHGIQQ